MNRRHIALLFALSLPTIIVAATHDAQAALGKSAASVASDSKALSAVRRTTTARNGFTVHVIVSDANTVREYVSPDGTIFAVAWNGLSHPDLTPLLGSYADEYRQALKQTPRKPGRRYLQVKANRVVVEKWGHMRNLQGRAYVPALIPTGVSVDEIK
ncbi:DUF2844 domain-containing protein [Geobacter sp. AOG1]|uniref:DUF2844 domain-containing protein n=1 Tax=Geobacter sp. AOG1 TaxID=1566346 RepID=UPI001CC62D96|nr:DUF2844 domain-containing protein [Geobacter sp. AOG1]GFE56829.1 hypothetical protein AOG1_07080 [Geobacter sp. AOG1]